MVKTTTRCGLHSTHCLIQFKEETFLVAMHMQQVTNLTRTDAVASRFAMAACASVLGCRNATDLRSNVCLLALNTHEIHF